MRGMRKLLLIPNNTHIIPSFNSFASETSPRLNSSNKPQNPDHLPIHQRHPNGRALRQAQSQLLTSGSLTSNPDTQIIIFNTLLKLHSLTNHPEKSLFLYKQFESTANPFHFDSFTHLFLVKACASLGSRLMGAQIHTRILKVGYVSHVYVGTALLNMYFVLGLLADARNLFDEMPERNVVTWNVMITGLVAWGEINAAREMFDIMPRRNVVSWTGIIDGYTRAEKYKEAVSLFRMMVREEEIMPTEVTFLAIFPAVAGLGDMRNCQSVHAYGDKSGLNVGDIRLRNCLIDTYSKCGYIKSAWLVFDEMGEYVRNLVSWTSIISGFAMHGMAKEAVESFQRMESQGLSPNQVTFLSVLSACSHGGLVEHGLEFFQKMRYESKLSPGIKHFGCVIDMLSRAGRLVEAEHLAWEIPQEIENVVVWRTLLGACTFHGNIEVAERVGMKMREMEKRHGGDYVMLSNIMTDCGKFGDAERVRSLMDEGNVSKVPGYSLS